MAGLRKARTPLVKSPVWCRKLLLSSEAVIDEISSGAPALVLLLILPGNPDICIQYRLGVRSLEFDVFVSGSLMLQGGHPMGDGRSDGCFWRIPCSSGPLPDPLSLSLCSRVAALVLNRLSNRRHSRQHLNLPLNRSSNQMCYGERRKENLTFTLSADLSAF